MKKITIWVRSFGSILILKTIPKIHMECGEHLIANQSESSYLHFFGFQNTRVFQDPRKLDRYALDKNAAALIQINSKFDYLCICMYQIQNMLKKSSGKMLNGTCHAFTILHRPIFVSIFCVTSRFGFYGSRFDKKASRS